MVSMMPSKKKASAIYYEKFCLFEVQCVIIVVLDRHMDVENYHWQ